SRDRLASAPLSQAPTGSLLDPRRAADVSSWRQAPQAGAVRSGALPKLPPLTRGAEDEAAVWDPVRLRYARVLGGRTGRRRDLEAVEPDLSGDLRLLQEKRGGIPSQRGPHRHPHRERQKHP